MEAEQAGKLSDQLKPQTAGTAHLQGTAENSKEGPDQMFTLETGPRANDQTHLDSTFLQQIQNLSACTFQNFAPPPIYMQVSVYRFVALTFGG